MTNASKIQPADLRFFVDLATFASLAEAARHMGVTAAAVSKRLSQMEARTGTTLVVRTPRKLSVTREGELLVEYAHRILGELDELEQILSGSRQALRGLIRVSASPGFGRLHVAPAITTFSERHPSLDLRLTLSENAPALSTDAFDVLVQFGAPSDSRMIARRLADDERVICAAPDYLARKGTPLHPRELVEHSCIDLRQGGQAYGIWRFAHADDPAAKEAVKIRAGLSTNDGSVAVEWALRGRGLLMRSMWNVAAHLARGELEQVLPQWRTPEASIYAVYPQQHRGSRRVKLFVEHLAECVAELKSTDRGAQR